MVGPQASPPTDKRTQRRRPGGLSGRRRLLWLIALSTVTLLLAETASAGADPNQVLVTATVYTLAGPEQPESVTLAEIEGCPAYMGPSEMEQYNAAGVDAPEDWPAESADPGEQGTWPLSSALTCMPQTIPLPLVDSITVLNGDVPETPALAPADFLDVPQPTAQSDFENPHEFPIIVAGGYAEYFRPRRNNTDANALDTVTSTDADGIDIQVFEAKSFPVTISEQTVSVPPGGRITFTSSPPPNGDPVHYDWTIDGQPSGTDSQDFTYTFPYAGTFTVGLEVTDPSADEIGAAAPVSVDVGTASQPPSTDTSTSVSNPSPASGGGSAPSGPLTSTGTTPGASPGTTPAPVAVQVSSAAHTTITTAVTTTRAATTIARTPTTSTTTTTRFGAAAAGASSGSGTGSSGAGSSPTSPTAPGPASATASSHPASPRRAPAPSRRASAAGTTLISGLLISGVVASPGASAAPAPQAGASAHPPALAPAGHISRLTGFAVAAGVLALLGLGVGRELRGRRVGDGGNRPRTA